MRWLQHDCSPGRGLALSVLIVFVLGAPLSAQVGSSASATTATTILTGTVVDSEGGFVHRAEAVIAELDLRSVTDEGGVFRLAVPDGRHTLLVRRLGYRAATVEITAPAASIQVRLTPLPEVLPPIAVSTPREVSGPRLAGFVARKSRGVGHFYDRAELDRRGYSLVDLIREIPSARIRSVRGGGRTVTFRGNCAPVVIIDGFPAAAGTFDLDMLDLSGFEAIEIYPGTAIVPAELQAPRGLERCGIIALWGRPARGRPPRPQTAAAPTSSVDLPRLLTEARVFSADAVDERATLHDGTLAPSYPELLWRDGVAGRVLLEFIVSRNGDVEPLSVAVASATHPMFAAAAVQAVMEARFRPASLAGRAVRQVVQLPVVFSTESAVGEP
jgi:TonB family protein